MSVSADSFRAEADMLAAIASAPAALAGRRRGTRNPQVLFEFFAAEGTPDIVVLEFDERDLERRDELGLNPVLNYNSIEVLLALREADYSTAELADRVRVSRAHLQRSILPELERRGWLQRSAGSWHAVHQLRPLARWIVAVEAKRRDWRRAVRQAERYRRFANRAVVVLDAATNIKLAEELLGSEGRVGLAAVDARAGRVRPVLLPAWHQPSSERDQVWAGEQAYEMRKAGAVSGPVLPVFGRTLLATSGDDPRIGPHSD